MIKKKGLFWGLITIFTFLFITFCEGEIGYVMGGDTEAYYLDFKHHIGVAPGYPLFIHILKVIFGNKLYLYIAAVLQIILVTGAVVYLIYTVYSIFGLKWWENLFVWFFSMLPFALLLPEDPLGHTLMTESLTYPLFYIFMSEMLKAVVRKQNKYFVSAILLGMLMAWIRPQMIFTYAIVGVGVAYVQISARIQNGKQKELRKNWLIHCMVACLIIFLCMRLVSGLTVVYEKVFFDAPALDYSDQTLVQRLLYVAEEDDAELFEDTRIREIYLETWQIMQEQETSQQYYDDDWKSWTEIFKAFGANSRILGVVIRDNLDEDGILSADTVGQEIQVSEISHELTTRLLGEHWKEHLLLTLQLLPKSFISTVFFHKTGIYNLILIATAGVYIFGVMGGIFCFFRKKTREAEWMFLVMGASAINAVACDLVLAGLQRYTAYTVGMTWIAVFIVVRGLFRDGYKWRKNSL